MSVCLSFCQKTILRDDVIFSSLARFNQSISSIFAAKFESYGVLGFWGFGVLGMSCPGVEFFGVELSMG